MENQHHETASSPKDTVPSSATSTSEAEKVVSSASSDVVPFPFERLMNATPGLCTLKQMLENIPRVKKAAYAEAVYRCPEVMLDECNPVAFLKREKYNTLTAAQRIVNYWTARLEIFGERAFMTMNLSSKGALGPEEVAAIRTGFLAVLPSDKMGHPVLLIDMSKVGKDIRDESIQRALFFMSSFISQNPMAQQGGFNVLCVHNQQFTKYASLMKTTSQMLDGALPIKVKEVFGIPLGVERSIFVQMAEWTAPLFSDQSITLVGGDSRDEVREKMAKYNIGMESLPQSLGGYWEPKNFQRWFDLQIAVKPTNPFTKLGFQVPSSMQNPLLSRSTTAGNFAAVSNNERAKPTDASDSFADPAPSSSQAASDALSALDEAIFMLPEEEKVEYMRTKKEAPSLIDKESNPILYLRFSKYNTWDAAKRLVRYWKERFHYFKERALLPMNQTGEGALSRKDVSVMSTGYCAVLPPDKEGRPVIFGDASRRGKHKDPDMLMRHMFYWNHCLLENSDQLLEKGIVVLIYVHKAVKAITSPDLKARLQLAVDCMPLRTHSVHVIPKLSRRSILDGLVPILFNFFPKNKRNRYYHRFKTNDEILDILEQHDLPRRDLPETIGGGWSYENFVTWQERRIRIEWELPLGVLGEDGDDFNAKSLSELTEDERRERKRRYNILHSRRKRRRDRLETDVLETQIKELNAERRKIMSEYERLRILEMQVTHEIQKSGLAAPVNVANSMLQDQQVPSSGQNMMMSMPMHQQQHRGRMMSTSSHNPLALTARAPMPDTFQDQIEPNDILQNQFNNIQPMQNMQSQRTSGSVGMPTFNNGHQQQQFRQQIFPTTTPSMATRMGDFSLQSTTGSINAYTNQSGNNMEQQQMQMMMLQNMMGGQQQSMNNNDFEMANQQTINSQQQPQMGQMERLFAQQSNFNPLGNQQFMAHPDHQQTHQDLNTNMMGSQQMFSAQTNHMNSMTPNSQQVLSQENSMNPNANNINVMNMNSYNSSLQPNQQQVNHEGLAFNDKFNMDQGFSF